MQATRGAYHAREVTERVDEVEEVRDIVAALACVRTPSIYTAQAAKPRAPPWQQPGRVPTGTAPCVRGGPSGGAAGLPDAPVLRVLRLQLLLVHGANTYGARTPRKTRPTKRGDNHPARLTLPLGGQTTQLVAEASRGGVLLFLEAAARLRQNQGMGGRGERAPSIASPMPS